MRAIRFLPLVFLLGIEGFAMFAPYVVLVLLLGYAAERLRTPALQPVTVDANLDLDDLPLPS